MAGFRPGFGRGGTTHSLEVTEPGVPGPGDAAGGAGAGGFMASGGGAGLSTGAGAGAGLSAGGEAADAGVDALAGVAIVDGGEVKRAGGVWCAVSCHAGESDSGSLGAQPTCRRFH